MIVIQVAIRTRFRVTI